MPLERGRARLACGSPAGRRCAPPHPRGRSGRSTSNFGRARPSPPGVVDFGCLKLVICIKFKYMKDATYRRTLKAARNELLNLYRGREETDRKIARLRQTVVTLGALCRESSEREAQKRWASHSGSLTEAVMDTIMASDAPLQPREIQRVLEDMGYDIGSSNPLASVHSVIRRLLQQRRLRGCERVVNNRPRLGFWWGDKKPPKPWKPHDWDPTKERRPVAVKP